MDNWKRALIWGSLGAGALLIATGKRSAGIALAGIGVAALAAEYPDKFEAAWRQAPDLIARGSNIIETLAQVGERISAQAGRSAGGRRMGPDYIT